MYLVLGYTLEGVLNPALKSPLLPRLHPHKNIKNYGIQIEKK